MSDTTKSIKFTLCQVLTTYTEANTEANSLQLVAYWMLHMRPKIYGVTWPWPRPFQGLLTKYFLWDVKGKLYSKFGEDRSRTELTILTVIAVWTDTGRTDGRTDGWTDGRTDAKVVLYSVQWCTLHWRDTNYYLRQVNEVNGGDNAFVRCVCLSVCLFVCAQRSVMGVKCQ